MKKILISRTDSIGDVILTLPMAGVLKEIYPDAEICFLGRNYTREIIRRSEHISQILSWDELASKPGPFTNCNVDAFIHAFPSRKIAQAARSSDIPVRIGTSHRLFHFWTCNKRVNFTRKKSELHESQLNLKLLAPLGYHTVPPLDEIANYIGWIKSTPNSPELPDNGKFNLVMHVKSKGSAREWALQNYLAVVREIEGECNIILTGTREEGELVNKACQELREHPAITDTFGKLTIDSLIDLIGNSDGLLACSTGPLHIAGVSGINTLGLYPTERPMHAGRWSPIGKKVSWLSGNTAETGLLDISVESVKKEIQSWIR